MLKRCINCGFRLLVLAAALIVSFLVNAGPSLAGSGDTKPATIHDTIKFDLTQTPVKSTSGRTVAPEFALRNTSGQLVHMSDFKGHVVLVDFWATWCPPCRASIPDLVSVYDSCHAAGFDILGITFERPGANALPSFVVKNSIRYPVLIGDRSVSASYGNVNALPTSVLVGRDGTIREQWIGMQPPGIIGKAVKELLKEKAPK